MAQRRPAVSFHDTWSLTSSESVCLPHIFLLLPQRPMLNNYDSQNFPRSLKQTHLSVTVKFVPMSKARLVCNCFLTTVHIGSISAKQQQQQNAHKTNIWRKKELETKRTEVIATVPEMLLVSLHRTLLFLVL